VSPRIVVSLALLLGAVVELAVLIKLGQLIGVWRTIGLVFLGPILGILVLRRQGLEVIGRLQRGFEEGHLPAGVGFEGLCLVAAGLLLILPGLVSDLLAFMLLLPPVRRLLYKTLGRRFPSPAAEGGFRGRPPPTGRAGEGTVIIDAEYEEVEVRPEEMPPPRGGWDRR
jgi:UPF0716 protein FxsA